MKILGELFIVSVASLCVFTACSSDKLSDEATTESIDYQDAFITEHQAVFDAILEDGFMTDAEFETITKLKGYEAFENFSLEEEKEVEVTNLQVEANGRNFAKRGRCLNELALRYTRKRDVCKTRKRKNRAACIAKALKEFEKDKGRCF